MNKVSLRIADLRKKAKVTQQELADSIGVSFQTVSRWETYFRYLQIIFKYQQTSC